MTQRSIGLVASVFVRTASLEEIVDRAYELILTSVGARLAGPAAQRP